MIKEKEIDNLPPDKYLDTTLQHTYTIVIVMITMIIIHYIASTSLILLCILLPPPPLISTLSSYSYLEWEISRKVACFRQFIIRC